MQLRSALTSMGEALDPSEAYAILSSAAVSGDGRIEYAEFSKALTAMM
jgi:Ca2+-binding EF-hand superfamily protein